MESNYLKEVLLPGDDDEIAPMKESYKPDKKIKTPFKSINEYIDTTNVEEM